MGPMMWKNCSCVCVLISRKSALYARLASWLLLLFLILKSWEGTLLPPEATEKAEDAEATEPCLAYGHQGASEESVEGWDVGLAQ